MIVKSIECETNPDYILYHNCSLKAVRRNKQLLNLGCYIINPLVDMHADVRLYRRFSGWRPFYIKFKMDFCKLVAGTATNMFMPFIMPILKKHTNIMHPCPLQHEIYLHDLDPGIPNLLGTHGSIFPSALYKLEIITDLGNRTRLGRMAFVAEIKELEN